MEKKITKTRTLYINYLVRERIINLVPSTFMMEWARKFELITWNHIYHSKKNMKHLKDIFYSIDEEERPYVINDIIKSTFMIKNNIDLQKLAEDTINIINNKYIIFEEHLKPDKIYKNDEYIFYKNLKFKIDFRINYLVQRSSYKRTLNMLLKYSSISISSEHCALPINVYNYLYEKLAVRGEGYSSPLNSKLIDKKDTVICSAFYDTDKYFSSLGPFTSENILKHQNVNWTVNPPYIAYIIKNTVRQIEEIFAKTTNENLLIIFVIPDHDIYKNVRKNSLVKKYIVTGGNDHYMNCNGNTVKMNRTNNCMYFFSKKNDIVNDEIVKEIKELWNTYILDNKSQSSFIKPIKIE